MLTKCGNLAAEWQRVAPVANGLLKDLKEQRQQPGCCWRHSKHLVAVYDGLRAAELACRSAQKGLTRMLEGYSVRAMGVHEYKAEVLVRKPHHFFKAAYDPHFAQRPARARLAALPMGHAARHEVVGLARVFEVIRDLLRRTAACVAGKGILIHMHLDSVGAMRAAQRALHAWQKDEAALVVQRAWRHSIADPAFKVCRARLLAEFAQLVGDDVL
ncbi:hypothetical protein COO60DRAFT_1646862 [Scenedesmus sp. NREL 46B-D3]|nr:hypothetical protein COO60DRAFT_1646862 [Scenedesmus sp. NREL 46B-D3]